MNPSPEAASDVLPRKQRSFEFDSPRWWLKCGIWLILIPGAFFWLARPPDRRPSKTGEIRMGILNARQIFVALSAFEEKYGRFPDEETASGFSAQVGPGVVSSNAIFRQLFADGLIQEEKIFHTEISGSRFPDGVMSGDNLLETGECAFSYFGGAAAGDLPDRPLLAAPMIPGTDRFDPKPFQGKAIVADVDGSVRSYSIDKVGLVMEGGKNLMDPSHPVWEGKPPAIFWPE